MLCQVVLESGVDVTSIGSRLTLQRIVCLSSVLFWDVVTPGASRIMYARTPYTTWPCAYRRSE